MTTKLVLQQRLGGILRSEGKGQHIKNALKNNNSRTMNQNRIQKNQQNTKKKNIMLNNELSISGFNSPIKRYTYSHIGSENTFHLLST